MRRKKSLKIKGFVKVFLVIVVVILVMFFSLNYMINNNDSYLVSLVDTINDNYNIDDNVNSVNVYGGYYIVLTDSKVLVLNREYENVFEESVSELSDNINNYDLVYRTNKLMYEDTVIDDGTLIYNYYDAYSYEYVSSIELE